MTLLLIWPTVAVAAPQPASLDRREVGWKTEFAGSGSSPVMADGVLFVGSRDGAVYAIDSSSGRLRWRFQTGEGLTSGPEVITVPEGTTLPEMMSAALARGSPGKKEVQATPVVEAGSVFIGSQDHSLYALDAASGNRRWAFRTGEKIYESAIVANDKVYVVSGDAVLYALESATGEKRWTFETLPRGANPRPPGQALLQGGTLYVTNWPFRRGDTPNTSYVHAVDAESGQARWTRSVDGGFVSEPAVTAGRVLVANSEDDTFLYAFDEASGATKWKASIEGGRHGVGRAPMVTGGMVYLETEKTLAAFDVATGAQKWRFATKGIEEGIAADERFVYVVSYGGLQLMPRMTLRALDAATGREAWSLGRSSVVSIQGIQRGTVYISAGAALDAIDSATGKKLWSFGTGTGVSSAPLITDRSLFVTSATQTFIDKPQKPGHLYAIDSKTGKLKP